MTTWSTTGAQVGRHRRSLAIAGAAATVIVLITNINRPPHARASADAIAIAGGVSITPVAGWTMADRGPDWVALTNPDSSAQLQVAVKPARRGDLVGLLQADVNQMIGTSTAGLSNVKNLSAPTTRTVQGANFQQEAFINYTADVSGPQGPIPVIGTFNELLNTSTRQTAFVNFRQDDSATTQVDNDGGAMINSML